jgi:hypothetical protein
MSDKPKTGLKNLIIQIISLIGEKDKIGYLKRETNNVTNLKNIIIAARKILESKGFKYGAIRGIVRFITLFTKAKMPSKRLQINTLKQLKINNSNVKKSLQSEDLVYLIQKLEDTHISRGILTLLNMNLISLTPEINFMIKYIADNFIELFVGMIDVINLESGQLKKKIDLNLINGEFTKLGSKIQNNPMLLYNFEIIEVLLNYVLGLICPYNLVVDIPDKNTEFPNCIESIFYLLFFDKQIINEELKNLSPEKYANLNTKIPKQEITIFKLIIEKIQLSFEAILKMLKKDEISNKSSSILFKSSSILFKSSSILFKLLSLLDEKENKKICVPLYIIITYYIKSILEIDEIHSFIRITYLEHILDKNIKLYKEHLQAYVKKMEGNEDNKTVFFEQILNILNSPSPSHGGGGQQTNKKTKKKGGLFTTYKLRNQNLFDKMYMQSGLPSKMMAGLSEGLNSENVDEIMSLQTDNNNLLHVMFKKEDGKFKYQNLRLLIGYTGVILNTENREKINSIVSSLVLQKKAEIYKSIPPKIMDFYRRMFTKYYYKLKMDSSKISIVNYRDGMLSTLGLFNALSFIISISYASLDDSMLKIFKPSVLSKILKTKKTIETRGILQIDPVKGGENQNQGKIDILFPEIESVVNFSLDSLVKIVDRFLYSKHIKLFGHTFKSDINKLESSKIRNILIFFLVYTNLNNFLDIVMKNDEKVKEIYKLMNYIIATDKVSISDEDEKNFKLIRQTLFDKIGNCFMFLKLNNLYDNFNLKNLLLILKSRKLNEKLELFKEKELKLLFLLFDGIDNYFDENLKDNHISYTNKFDKNREEFNHRFLNIINYCINYSFMVSHPLFEEILSYKIVDNQFICHETKEYLKFNLNQQKLFSSKGIDRHESLRNEPVFFLKI